MTSGTAATRRRGLLRGPRRKDDQTPELHAERSALRVERCEVLPLNAESALLRVVGRWAAEPPARVELLVGRDLLAVPLPPGPAVTPGGEWTAGFEVPASAAAGAE